MADHRNQGRCHRLDVTSSRNSRVKSGNPLDEAGGPPVDPPAGGPPAATPTDGHGLVGEPRARPTPRSQVVRTRCVGAPRGRRSGPKVGRCGRSSTASLSSSEPTWSSASVGPVADLSGRFSCRCGWADRRHLRARTGAARPSPLTDTCSVDLSKNGATSLGVPDLISGFDGSGVSGILRSGRWGGRLRRSRHGAAGLPRSACRRHGLG